MTPVERAMVAAVFLAKWTDAAEEPTRSGLEARVQKALAMADRLFASANHLPEEPAPVPERCASCGAEAFASLLLHSEGCPEVARARD
jgi:hypothetical protein